MVYDSNTNSLIYSGGAERPEAGVADSFDFRDTWMLNLNDVNAGWQTKKSLPFDSNHMSFATVKDQAGLEHHFFVGGQVGVNEFTGNVDKNYEYDVLNDEWIEKADMPFTRGHAASSTRAIGCGFIMAGGSTNENGLTSDVSFYSTETDDWRSIGDLPEAINTPVCDVNFDTMYLYCESGFPGRSFSFRRKIALVSS